MAMWLEKAIRFQKGHLNRDIKPPIPQRTPPPGNLKARDLRTFSV